MKPAEARLTSYLFEKAARLKLPLSGTFELSPVCNFSCRMCYVRKSQAEVDASPRPILTYDRWLELARQAKEEGMLYLLLTGGEPFLWHRFPELYEQLAKMGFVLSINSNGSLLNGDLLELFRTYPPSRVNITLYGASDAAYESLCGVPRMFSRVDAAITALRGQNTPVKLNCSLTPHNVRDLPDMSRYAEERGLIFETNTYMFPAYRRDASLVGKNDRFTPSEAAKYNLEAFRLAYGEEQYRKRLRAIAEGVIPPPGLDESCVDPLDGSVRCRAGKASFWLTWDGRMTPCGLMQQPSVDAASGSFADAWQQLNTLVEKEVLSGTCASCKNRQLCHSCAAMAQAETGTSSGVPRYLCEMVDAMRTLARNELCSE